MVKNTEHRSNNYFEAIIQLRNPSQELINFVANQVEKRGVTIAKIEKCENGADIYISDQRYVEWSRHIHIRPKICVSNGKAHEEKLQGRIENLKKTVLSEQRHRKNHL